RCGLDRLRATRVAADEHEKVGDEIDVRPLFDEIDDRGRVDLLRERNLGFVVERPRREEVDDLVVQLLQKIPFVRALDELHLKKDEDLLIHGISRMDMNEG